MGTGQPEDPSEDASGQSPTGSGWSTVRTPAPASGETGAGGVRTTPDAPGTRAAVYRALAEALAGPVPGIESLLLDAVRTGARVLGSAACQRAALALAKCPARGLEALRDSYTRLVAGPGWPIALYESLHRQGHLAGPATWDVERHYRTLGLTPIDGELPDHASVELAFLSHLAAAEAEAGAAGDGRLVVRLRVERHHFLHTHAGAWLPEMGARLATADDPFYAAVGHLLNEFLAEELSGRKRNGQTCTEPGQSAGAQLPALKDPAACTLCGLCVGSCRPGALRVMESATETALTLNPWQCIGCGRCVDICPDGVLALSSRPVPLSRAGATDRAGYQVLRRSPRATCPRCGRPTVSQAELEAVFARLQPDPAMQRHLSLCIACKSWRMWSRRNPFSPASRTTPVREPAS